MADELPVYLIATDPAGEIMNDKDGNPVRMLSWPVKYTDIESIKQTFRMAFNIEISDENAEKLKAGGIVRLR